MHTLPASTGVSSRRVSSHPRLGITWVVQTAIALVAIAAWLTVLLHLAIIVHAEIKLAQIVHQSNAFAELPSVDSRELAGYAHRRISASGLQVDRLQVAGHPTEPGKLQVTSIEATPTDAVSRWLRPVGRWLGHEAAGSTTDRGKPFLGGREK